MGSFRLFPAASTHQMIPIIPTTEQVRVWFSQLKSFTFFLVCAPAWINYCFIHFFKNGVACIYRSFIIFLPSGGKRSVARLRGLGYSLSQQQFDPGETELLVVGSNPLNPDYCPGN